METTRALTNKELESAGLDFIEHNVVFFDSWHCAFQFLQHTSGLRIVSRVNSKKTIYRVEKTDD